MTPHAAISAGFKNACSFTGRATRAEFWWFTLFCLLLTFVMPFFDLHLFPSFYAEDSTGTSPLADLSFVILALPLASVGARRLQDTGFNGWPAIAAQVLTVCYFASLWLPSVGNEVSNILFWLSGILSIIVWVACLYPSQPRENRFGLPVSGSAA